MPTGYTADLCEKGQSFPDFALGCARAFGALILMRDEPPDAAIPDRFEPSDYHVKEGEKARDEFERLSRMSDEEQLVFGHARQHDRVTMLEDLISRDLAQNERLDTMRQQVKAWQPPTDEHHGLKRFMLEQIDTSMSDPEYFQKELSKEKWKEPLAFYQEELKNTRSSIEYHALENAKEIERAKDRTEWVLKLRASLPKP